MNTVDQERLKKSRQKVTITGESRVAYARIEIPTVTGIPERTLKDVEDMSLFPAPIFLWGEKFYTGHQLTLMYLVWKEKMSWGTLRSQWPDPDTEDDLWPRMK